MILSIILLYSATQDKGLITKKRCYFLSCELERESTFTAIALYKYFIFEMNTKFPIASNITHQVMARSGIGNSASAIKPPGK